MYFIDLRRLEPDLLVFRVPTVHLSLPASTTMANQPVSPDSKPTPSEIRSLHNGCCAEERLRTPNEGEVSEYPPQDPDEDPSYPFSEPTSPRIEACSKQPLPVPNEASSKQPLPVPNEGCCAESEKLPVLHPGTSSCGEPDAATNGFLYNQGDDWGGEATAASAIVTPADEAELLNVRAALKAVAAKPDGQVGASEPVEQGATRGKGPIEQQVCARGEKASASACAPCLL